MANVQYKVKKSAFGYQNNIQIMTVNEVIKGEAILLENMAGEIMNDFIHAASVPILNSGDNVIVQNISNNLIITDKLRVSGEKPTAGFEVNDDGSLSIYSSVSIILKTKNAKIDILENGRILIDGAEVYSLSKGVNRIQGTSIELN